MLADRSGKHYRPDIDGLRAVAVVAVIINHFKASLLPGGYLGVDIFFVISGYVITASLMEDRSETFREFLGRFYARRIKRLLPALITCIVVTAFLGAVFINPHTEAFKSSMRAGLYALIGLSNMDFFNHAADYFASSTGLNLFTHTWSLGVEEQFYVVFPALFWLGLRTGTVLNRQPQYFAALLAMLAIASWAANTWLLEVKFPGTYFLMPPRFWELGLGSIIFLYGGRITARTPRTRTILAIAAVVGGGVALALDPEWEVLATSIVVLATATLIHSLRPGQLTHRWLTLGPVVAIGLMSYSLYLWHWSVLVLCRWTVGTTGWMAVLEIGLIVALSMATYTHIERPLRKAQWAAKHSITIGYGAIAVVLAAAFIQALVHPLSRFLYAGKPAQLAQAGVASLLNDRLSNGRVIWPAKDCVLTSDQDVGKTISWDRCTFGDEKTASRRFLVIGNSFSAAEFEMYSAVAEKGLGPVTVTSSWGASPAPGMVNRSAWSKANEYYWNDVVPLLVTSLRAGDVLVMINDLADLLSEGAQAGEEQKNSLNLLEAGLSNISEGMNHRGIAVVFQTSIPFMRDAQCTPDMAKRQWFNIGAPQICTFHTRVETLARRKPLDDVLQRVRKRNPNFAVLDLMPIMCAGKMCGMTNKGGSYLYRDEWSHPSVEANHLSRELFLSAVEVDVARGR